MLTSLLVTATCCVAGDGAAVASVFVLHRRDGEFAVESLSLERGRSQRLDAGPDSDVVDVILPVGPGMSGNVAQRVAGRQLDVEFDGAELRVAETLPGQPRFERPPRRLADLDSEIVRVCARDGGAASASFRLERGTAVRDDAGPAFDLFAGRIPLTRDQVSITTETRRRWDVERSGAVRLSYDRWPFATVYLDAGAPCRFLVDFGAASTVVAARVVPGGREVKEQGILQVRGGNRELLPYVPEGATGPVPEMLGSVRLALAVGDEESTIELGEATVDVLAELPVMNGEPIDGILGLDLLACAGSLAIDLSPGAERLVWAGPPPSIEGAPFAIVRGHVLFRGELASGTAYFLVDTGSPDTVFDDDASERLRLEVDRERGELAVGGLGAGRSTLRPLTPVEWVVGGVGMRAAPAWSGALPILASLRGEGQNVAILGNSTLRAAARVTFDFVHSRVTFGSR